MSILMMRLSSIFNEINISVRHNKNNCHLDTLCAIKCESSNLRNLVKESFSIFFRPPVSDDLCDLVSIHLISMLILVSDLGYVEPCNSVLSKRTTSPALQVTVLSPNLSFVIYLFSNSKSVILCRSLGEKPDCVISMSSSSKV